MGNTATVQEIYGAFGRGDVQTILEKLAEDVAWDADGREDVPFMEPRQGRDAVVGFFEGLGAAEFTRFEPTALLESGNIVVALIDVALRVKSTGKPFEQSDEVHIWRFGENGLVTSFRHRLDTHAMRIAFER